MIDPKELLFAVDERNNPIDPIDRKSAHEQGVWHRGVNVWILNGDKALCQKRSMLKDTNPGKWEAWVGGHMAPNEDYIDAAVKEMSEEVGLNLAKEDFKQMMIAPNTFDDPVTGAHDREFLGIFIVNWNGDISKLELEAEEVEEVKWFSIEEIQELIGKSDDWVNHGYEQELIDKIKTGASYEQNP